MSHTRSQLLRAVTAALLIGGVLATGCAKKQVAAPETTPVPPAPAPVTPTPTPTPPPPPVEAPAPTPGQHTEDYMPAFFDYDSYSLRDDAKTALDGNAKLLRDNPKVTLTIEGHCDERGTVEYNQALGERRAQAARDYLVAAGIDAQRLSVISYGKEKPFATGSDEASWQQNRRAHFVVRASS